VPTTQKSRATPSQDQGNASPQGFHAADVGPETLARRIRDGRSFVPREDSTSFPMARWTRPMSLPKLPRWCPKTSSALCLFRFGP